MAEGDSTSAPRNELKTDFELILSGYPQARTQTFGKGHEVWKLFERLANRLILFANDRHKLKVKWSVGAGNWSLVPWIAFLDSRETTSTQRGVYPVFLFREDMSGVYITFNQGVTDLIEQYGTPEGRRILRDRAQYLVKYCEALATQGFSIDTKIDLHTRRGLGRNYEFSTVAYKLYVKGAVPNDDVIGKDLQAVLQVYDAYLKEQPFKENEMPGEIFPVPESPNSKFEVETAIHDVISYIAAKGFNYEPWQIAQYITAVRTKPFVILAGISGTGKSKLPALVAEATGGESRLVPVRPDWTDSADVLGYTDLNGHFRPGSVLEIAHQASANSDRFWTCIIDEMNLARVEQYFAEVLSRIEARYKETGGGYKTNALIIQPLQEKDAEWRDVIISSNLAIAGTVNMDESAHGFSRKVLDRAFTIELSNVDLERWGNNTAEPPARISTWPVTSWYPRAIMLSEVKNLNEEEREEMKRGIAALQAVNKLLIPAQLQVGYRTRDEVAFYLLHARDISNAFVSRDGNRVDPLDLALQMKILPRIVGGSSAVRRCVLGLLGWATTGIPLTMDEEVRPIIDSWLEAERPSSISTAKYPRLAARLCLMWERLETEGYTSYWL
jgi:GTPase subunit of restriction endonuclease